MTDNGALEPEAAELLVRNFLAELQLRGAPIQPQRATWTSLGTYEERAEWVTRALLDGLLPAEEFGAQIIPRPDDSREKKSRALLRCRAPFVALLSEDRRFLRLLNRQKYLEEVAAALGEEPESARG